MVALVVKNVTLIQNRVLIIHSTNTCTCACEFEYLNNLNNYVPDRLVIMCEDEPTKPNTLKIFLFFLLILLLVIVVIFINFILQLLGAFENINI